jgi:hypothetical protein
MALKKASEEDFLARLKTLRLMDRDAVDAFEIDMRAATKGLTAGPFFNSQTMRSSPF